MCTECGRFNKFQSQSIRLQLCMHVYVFLHVNVFISQHIIYINTGCLVQVLIQCIPYIIPTARYRCLTRSGHLTSMQQCLITSVYGMSYMYKEDNVTDVEILLKCLKSACTYICTYPVNIKTDRTVVLACV